MTKGSVEGMGIVEFLRARLDEDEAAAKTCAEMFPPPWEAADRGWRVRIYSGEVPDVGDHAEPGWVRHPVVMEVEPDRIIDDPKWLSERVEHVVRHDPARVLREVAAKRRIVEEHPLVAATDVGIRGGGGVGCRNCHTLSKVHDDSIVEAVGPCDTLLALASVYADHPDYDPEWALDASDTQVGG